MCALGRASRSADTVTYEQQACGASLIHPQVALTGEEGGLKGSEKRHLGGISLTLPSAPPPTRGAAAHCAATDQGYARAGLAVLCNSTELGCATLVGSSGMLAGT